MATGTLSSLMNGGEELIYNSIVYILLLKEPSFFVEYLPVNMPRAQPRGILSVSQLPY